jgi:glycerophosphoryl diester phosphodiesterase
MRYVRASFVTAVVLTGGLFAAPAAQAAHPADSTPCATKLISAHEGYTANADGDTVDSQQAAYDIGANIADSDIWVTKDGYIVEIHDNDVSHSTDGTGFVTEMTLDQVLQLRTKQHHEPVPQLNDSLAIPGFHEPGRYFMFETKYSFADPDYLQLLDNEITAAGMTNNVIIYSAYLKQMHTLKALDPALTVWYKANAGVPDVSDVKDLDGVMIPVGSLTKKVSRKFHKVGLTVIRERVNTETQDAWNHFIKTKADGLMSGDPVTVINECRAMEV